MCIGSVAAEHGQLPRAVDAGDGLECGNEQRRGRAGKRHEKPGAKKGAAAGKASPRGNQQGRCADDGHEAFCAVVKKPAPGMMEGRIDGPQSARGVIPVTLDEEVDSGVAFHEHGRRHEKKACRALPKRRAAGKRHAFSLPRSSGSSMTTMSPPSFLFSAHMRP